MLLLSLLLFYYFFIFFCGGGIFYVCFVFCYCYFIDVLWVFLHLPYRMI